MHAIANMKETDASLQAKVWVKLARASSNKYKQFNAYTKAIELLQNVSVEIVEVLMEFGEWLLRNSYSLSKVTDTLLQAADILIEVELGEDDEEDEGSHKAPTIMSKSSRRSGVKSKKQKSRMGSKARSRRSKLKRSGRGSSRRGTQLSKKSGRSRMSRSSRRTRSRRKKTKKTKSVFTEREEDPFPDELNCLHYERLFRTHAILSMVAETTDA